MKITLVCVGKLKEDYWRDAMAEYTKRLSRYCTFDVVEVVESRNQSRAKADIDRAKQEEGERILAACKGAVVALDLGGAEVSSEEIASFLQQSQDKGQNLCFVIGGSDGLSPAVLDVSSRRIRFGRITLPHQLCRVVATEQIYRGFSIMYATAYHK